MENETLSYMLFDYATEKIICFCDTETQVQEAKDRYIADCTRKHKWYDLYVYENIN